MSEPGRALISNIVSYLRGKALVQGLTRTQPLYYVAYPRSDPVEFPIIAFTPTGGGRTHMSIGNTGNRYTNTYQVDIYTDTDAVSSFAGNNYSQHELVAYLYDMINLALRDYRCEIIDSYSIIDIWINPIRLLPYNEDLDFYRGVCTMTIQVNDPRQTA